MYGWSHSAGANWHWNHVYQLQQQVRVIPPGRDCPYLASAQVAACVDRGVGAAWMTIRLFSHLT